MSECTLLQNRCAKISKNNSCHHYRLIFFEFKSFESSSAKCARNHMTKKEGGGGHRSDVLSSGIWEAEERWKTWFGSLPPVFVPKFLTPWLEAELRSFPRPRSARLCMSVVNLGAPWDPPTTTSVSAGGGGERSAVVVVAATPPMPQCRPPPLRRVEGLTWAASTRPLSSIYPLVLLACCFD